MILSPSDLLALCQRHGAPPGVARIATACALVESGGDTEAVGDNGHSTGLWMMHDQGLGAGLTVAERQDPDTAATVMVPQFVASWIIGQDAGYTGEQLARYVAIWTERPAGWPNLDSPAADKYAAMWQTLGETAMPEPRTYNPNEPAIAQTDSWSCSVASAAWALRSVGIDISYPALEAEELMNRLVSTEDGLLVATGGPLAGWLAQRFDLATDYDPDVSWGWLVAHAGSMPILLGGRRWGQFGHWVGVRDAGQGVLLLANPAEGYAGIWSTLTEERFNAVGPCSAVWFLVGEGEDMGRIADLENQVGYLMDAGRICREEIDKALAVKRLPKAARETLQYGAKPAAETIERGGA